MQNVYLLVYIPAHDVALVRIPISEMRLHRNALYALNPLAV